MTTSTAKWLSVITLAAPLALLAASGVYDFTLPSITGQQTPLSGYKGKVLLVVNVASQCGYTPQYKGLEALYEKYKDQGFVIAGFPANNFGGQEPGTNEEIKSFCSRNYHVSFPMFSKISVKGADQAPLYRFLTNKAANPSTGGEIGWNFTKFLVNRQGRVVGRFDSRVEPESPELVKAVEQALR